MTREEAREILDKMPLCNECDSSNFPYTCVECGDAFMLTMEALKQPEIVQCKDCIHRGKAEKCVLAAISEEKNFPLFMLDNRGEWFCADGKRGEYCKDGR